jgi:uncharacterized damage-inducible protein DinB
MMGGPINNQEIDRIIQLLDNTFSGPHPWHGAPVMEVLKYLSPELAAKKISNNTHSIVELVLHMAAGRNFGSKKLRGEEFEMSDELNFPQPVEWKEALARLQHSQGELLTALRSFPAAQLTQQVPGRKYDFYTLLHGIVHHDLYHTGQIALLKKAGS